MEMQKYTRAFLGDTKTRERCYLVELISLTQSQNEKEASRYMNMVKTGLECSTTIVISDISSWWAAKYTSLGFVKYNLCPSEKMQLWSDLFENIESLWHIFKESSFPMELLLLFTTPLSTVWWWVHWTKFILFFFFQLPCSRSHANHLNTFFFKLTLVSTWGREEAHSYLRFIPSSSSSFASINILNILAV